MKKRHNYTKEQKKYIADMFNKEMSMIDVTTGFNEKFGTNLDKYSIYRVYRYNKILKKKFTDDQLKWLKKESIKYDDVEDVYEEFIKKFGEIIKPYEFEIRFSKSGLYTKTSSVKGKRLDWIKNNTKGKTLDEIMDEYYKTFKVPLKETALRGILFRHNLDYSSKKGLPLGSLRHFNNEIYIKVMKSDGNMEKENPMTYQKPYWMKLSDYVYLVNGGKINDNECIVHKDGNKNNFSLDNLVKVTTVCKNRKNSSGEKLKKQNPKKQKRKSNRKAREIEEIEMENDNSPADDGLPKERLIMEVFEEYLAEVGAVIPNKERDEAKSEDPSGVYSIIYGEDYYKLEDKIKNIIDRY